ncbi:unnamed protein product [Ectocarpus sp. 12 AP-2014]
MVSRGRAATAVALPQHQQEEKEEGGGGSGGNGGDPIAVQGGAGGEGSLAESSYSIMNNTFRVDSRYSGLKAIGKGSFGFVCSALDEKQGKKVAIKKIHPMAQHVVDAKHVLREIRLMRYLGSHPNIVSLEDLFISEHYDELYIVMELLDSDLHRIIQSPQALGDAHHRYFMFQLLKGVKFLHSNRIIHRDLKPGNVLVTKNCHLRITDFGLARLRPMGRGTNPDDEVDHPMTEHVVTRWYRPPELMLCPDGLYGYAVDLWSVGCIFAELLGRHPLFPGKNFMDQLTLIFDLVGSPKPHEVAHIRNSQAKKFLETMQDRVKVPYAELFTGASEHAIDLLEGLLVFHPPCRLSVDEALEHPYFHPLRKSDTNPDPDVSPGFEFDFESKPLCRVQLKKMILAEVESFQRAQRKRDRRARAAAAATASAAGGGASAAATAAGTNENNDNNLKECTSSNGSTNSVATSTTASTSSTATASTAAATDNSYHRDYRTAEAAAVTAEDRLQDHQYLLRRSRRHAVAAVAVGEGGGSAGMHRGEGGGEELERAPISAVRSAQQQQHDHHHQHQPTSEAATVRAGLGSFKNASQQSHWGGGSSAQALGGSHRSSPQVPPPSDTPDTQRAPFNVQGSAGRGGAGATHHHPSGGAEPMDDDDDWDCCSEALTPPQHHHGDATGRSPGQLTPPMEYQGRSSGYLRGGVCVGGHRVNGNNATNNISGAGVHEGLGHDHRWRGGGGGAAARTSQQMLAQQHQQSRDTGGGGGGGGTKWSPATSTCTGVGVESLQSPVRIRRSVVPTAAAAASSVFGTGSRRLSRAAEGQQRQQQHRGGAANRGGGARWGLGSRRSGLVDGAGAAAGGEQYRHHHHPHQQQQDQYHQQPQHPHHHHHQQQQSGDGWCAKATGLRDVEDRFHQLKFGRARARNAGRRSHDDMPDPTAGMRAPKR